MKIKKVIAVIAGIAVALSAAVGGVYGYKSYQDKKLVAEVQPVSSLNWGYWGDTETSYGTVTNDSSQEIYLDDSRMIKEVYVEKGDEVQKGDPLLAYDTAELQIEIERKKLDISTIENNIERQKYKYEMLPGYEFAGWTLDGSGMLPATTLIIYYGTTGDLHYKAEWRLAEYTINMDLNGGSGKEKVVYTITDEDFELPTPTRNGYEFVGCALLFFHNA